jgi:hypothetical protein
MEAPFRDYSILCCSTESSDWVDVPSSLTYIMDARDTVNLQAVAPVFGMDRMHYVGEIGVPTARISGRLDRPLFFFGPNNLARLFASTRYLGMARRVKSRNPNFCTELVGLYRRVEPLAEND